MKKLLILWIIFVVLLSACAPEIVQSGGVVVRGETETTAPVDLTDSYAGETIVYVTASGTKYHTGDCSYLSASKIPISLEQAIAEGREPCSRCHPPAEP